MNSNTKFAMFYVAMISVTLVGSLSLYANHLNSAWNRVVFTFPPEVQKVVENGTATMEVKWRWLPDTLEMIIKVNDDEFNIVEGFLDEENTTRDYLSLLFDSDNNGNLSNRSELQPYSLDDHAVFVWGLNHSWVLRHSYIDSHKEIVFPHALCGLPTSGVFLVGDLNNTYFVCKEGYTYHISIPLEFINIKNPTPICINYFDGDYVAWLQSSGIDLRSDEYLKEYYKSLLFGEFTG